MNGAGGVSVRCCSTIWRALLYKCLSVTNGHIYVRFRSHFEPPPFINLVFTAMIINLLINFTKKCNLSNSTNFTLSFIVRLSSQLDLTSE